MSKLVKLIIYMSVLFPILLKAKTDFNGIIDNLSNTKQNDIAVQDYFLLANKNISHPEQAKKLINKAKIITQKIDSKNAWIKFYYEAGKIYSSMNAYDLLSDALLNEYQFYKDTDLQRKYLIESELGVLYANLKDEKTAAFYFEKLVKHYSTTDQYVRYALAISNLAGQYSKNPQKALGLYRKSLQVLKKKPNNELKSILLINIGCIYTQLHQPNKALDHLNKAKALVTSKSDKDVIATLNLYFAEAYQKNKDLKNALNYALQSENNIKYLIPADQKNLIKLMHGLYEEMQDYKKASDYFTKYIATVDQLKTEETILNVERVKIHYNNQILQQSEELKTNKQKLYISLAIFILIFIVLVLIIIVNRNRNNLQKIKWENELKKHEEIQLKQDLEIRNKELALKSIKETEQSELYQLLLGNLKEIESNLQEKEETKKTVGQVIRTIKQNSTNNNWTEFEMRFANVYDSFYKKLNKIHPDLSTQDQRICALIKLNLTTKEISNITKSSVRSIENARTRLRKKLDLTNNKIELSKYISDF